MSSSCFRFENIEIEVKAVRNCCEMGLQVGDRFTIDSIIPGGLCPFLYHSTLPYLEAVENGASFNVAERNFIVVQCPNPKAGIAVKIHKKNNQDAIIEFHGKKSDCPYYDFKMGDDWQVSKVEKVFCRRAYDSLFPYLNALSSQIRTGNTTDNALTATCPGYPDYVVFHSVVSAG